MDQIHNSHWVLILDYTEDAQEVSSKSVTIYLMVRRQYPVGRCREEERCHSIEGVARTVSFQLLPGRFKFCLPNRTANPANAVMDQSTPD